MCDVEEEKEEEATFQLNPMSNKPYDPYIPDASAAVGGSANAPSGQKPQKTAAIQAQIDDSELQTRLGGCYGYRGELIAIQL